MTQFSAQLSQKPLDPGRTSASGRAAGEAAAGQTVLLGHVFEDGTGGLHRINSAAPQVSSNQMRMKPAVHGAAGLISSFGDNQSIRPYSRVSAHKVIKPACPISSEFGVW